MGKKKRRSKIEKRTDEDKEIASIDEEKVREAEIIMRLKKAKRPKRENMRPERRNEEVLRKKDRDLVKH